jgi:hypothetical protein
MRGPDPRTHRDNARPFRFSKKKKDQLALAQYGDNYSAIGPIPTIPGGWGLRNPESKGPSQRSVFLVAFQQGGRLAEVGRYYDSC